MTHGSLFSGIGGFDLAAEWMGWENVFHCEWNPFCQKILNHYWPKATSYHDITKTDFSIHRGRIDVLSGGFPCQPFSSAGEKKGTGDSRYLWPEMLRVIREVRPRWVLGENVYGLINWNGGVVLDTVCADLENEGFSVLPIVLPACSQNAPHRRDRIFIVAHAIGVRDQGLQCELGLAGQGRQGGQGNEEAGDNDASDTNSLRQQGPGRSGKRGGTEEGGDWENYIAFDGMGWPTEPPVRRANDGIPQGLDGITFSAWAQESIKAYGNAVVPQVVFQIFKSIQAYEDLPTSLGGGSLMPNNKQ